MIQDIKDRLSAILPSNKNIIVEAGAGTGKTTLLINRLCYQILDRGLKVDEIIALTFTEKAAAEIKIRLLEEMQKILSDLSFCEEEFNACFLYKPEGNPCKESLPEKKFKSKITKDIIKRSFLKTEKKELSENKETLEKQEEILSKIKEDLIKKIEETFELIEHSQICTIHSFAFHILKLYPLEAGLAPQVEVDTGFIREYVFNKNWSAFLEEELTLNNPRRNLWEELLTELTLEDLKKFAFSLNDPHFEYYSVGNTPDEIKEYILNKIAIAEHLVNANFPEGKKKKRGIENCLEEAVSRLKTFLTNISSLNREEILKSPILEPIIFKKPSKYPEGWESEEEIEFAVSFIDLANAMIPQKLYLLDQAYKLFMPFIKDFKNDLKKQNIINYDKMILLARDLVQKNLAVRKELKKRYKSLMIDEFQDTDIVQGELLLFLAEEQNSCAKNWQDIILEQGKLFVVGDPKQSIYRFRGADVSAYHKFLEFMQNQQACPCYLTTNFRSHERIINFVNQWGQSAIKEKHLIQAPYIPLKPFKNILGEKPEFLQITSREGDDVSSKTIRKNEANIVANWIKDNVGKTKLADGKVLSYKDITILYSTSNSASIYTDALKRYDIPYNLEVGGNFYKAQEVLDILNILKVIYDPQDKLALIGVLRSPLCAMKDEEIISLWQQKALNIFAQDFEASKAVKNLYNLLKKLHLKAGHITLKELIEEIFYKTDFLIFETLAAAGEQALANLLKFERFVLENASKGFTLAQLLFYIETYGKKDKEDSQITLAEENFDVVNLMTIHKSKGLEAPVVILVDTCKKEKTNQEEKNFLVDTLNSKIGLSLGSLKNLNYLILQERESLHDKAEKERLLYVALTRAKQKLLICVSEKKTQGIIEKSLRNSGCYPAADNLENDLFKTISFPFADPQSFLFKQNKDITKQHTLDWSFALPLWQKRKAEYENYKQEEIVAPSHLQGNKSSAQKALDIGSAVHRTLHIYFQTGVFDLPLALRQLDLQADDEVLNTCRKIINTFAKGDILKELKTMEFLGSEIPFTMTENGFMVNGIIDALFRKPGGQLFIVDFKTDKIDNKDLKQYSLKYEQQLTLYKRAVQKMFRNQEVISALAYLSIDKLFEI